jgi:hypothetical protein
MRVSPPFVALHLYPSDTDQAARIRVGMRGLRHKQRHNFLSCRTGTWVKGWGGVDLTPFANAWAFIDISDFSKF